MKSLILFFTIALGACLASGSWINNPTSGGGGSATLTGPVTNIQFSATANGTNFVVAISWDATNKVFRIVETVAE